MKKKKTKSLAMMLLVLAGYGVQQYFKPGSAKPSSSSRPSRGQVVNSKKIGITKHARCRMDCRKIDMSEIKLALSQGKINIRKSEPKKKPCPVYAREVYSQKDKQRIRVISADCTHEQTIITVIDLGNEYDCYCE